MPVSRPRAMLIAARSSGRPSRLLRSASTMNSSISLPRSIVMPRTMAPRRLRHGRCVPSLSKLDGIEERLDQAESSRSGSGSADHPDATPRDRIAVRIEARHVLRQHGVAEAVDHVGELAEDRRIDVGDGVEHEHVDHRLDLARELLEDEMLILHLGGEARRLEQALAVPVRDRRLAVGLQLRAQRSAALAKCRAAARRCRLASHSLMKARSPLCRIVSFCASTCRLCSEWKIWWTAVRPIFSLPRPSPVMKCRSRSSLS